MTNKSFLICLILSALTTAVIFTALNEMRAKPVDNSYFHISNPDEFYK